MKARIYSLLMILVVFLPAIVAYQGMVGAEEEPPPEAVIPEGSSLEEAIIGIWDFPVDGYYLGFDGDGRLCYGGSEESVAAKRWCNQYTLEDGIVTETCMGGPEDRNCPLGGGSCRAKVSVDEAGQLHYRILQDQCDMLEYKIVPPSQYHFTRD